MDKRRVVALLGEVADLAEIESDQPFRARSFRNAARALEAFTGDFTHLVEKGGLEELKGIGPSLAAEIRTIHETGQSPRLLKLLERVPEGVRDMLGVPGLGPKRIRLVWRELGVTDIRELRARCERGDVANLPGMGERSQEKLLAAIDYALSSAGRYLVPEAELYAGALAAHLRDEPAVERLEVAGSYRRKKEVLKDLDIVASTSEPEAVAAHFLAFPAVREVVARGKTKTSVRLENGLPVDLRLVEDRQFPAALAYFTGSKDHNTALRRRALDRGLKLNEYGLFRGEEELPVAAEADIYQALGLPLIPPELREDLGEIELAERGALPRLVEASDIRGVLHVHTVFSDGDASLEQLVEASRERGLEYLGVSDHSQSAYYAGGLKEEDVRRQHAEIDRLNAKLKGFRIFKGIESDIRPDGSLDYPRAVLESFDFVVASLHSNFQLSLEDQTERVVRALEDPHTTMLGHMTARLLLRRSEVALDIDRVLEAAASFGVVVEINANPHRLDLDWRHGPRARELGILTAINPDAHVVGGIDDMRYGVGTARKAGFSKEEVINTYDTEKLEALFARRKKRR